MLRLARRFSGRTSHQGNSSTERLRKEVEATMGALDQAVESILARLSALEASGDGGGAPLDATYVTLTSNATLTDERRIVAGAGISLTDAGANSTLTIACTVTGVTTEDIQDVVGALVTDSPSVTWSYNDGAGTLTALVPAEYVQDTVAAFVVEGTGISITYNDVANTLTFATDVTVGEVADRVLYTIDYSTLANNALSGTESLDSRNYTITNEASATLLEILNGTGLHFDASTASTAFSSSSQTAPRLEVTLSQLLGTSFNPSRRLRIDCRLASWTLGVNNNFFAFGMAPNTSAFGNMGFAQKIRTGGVISSRHFGPGSSSTSVVTAAHDVFSLLIDDNEIRTYAAVWAGSYPELRDMTRLGASSASIGASADEDGFLQSGARVFFSFATGETGGTMDVVVRELRVSEVL